jgi:hypothetical protein
LAEPDAEWLFNWVGKHDVKVSVEDALAAYSRTCDSAMIRLPMKNVGSLVMNSDKNKVR